MLDSGFSTTTKRALALCVFMVLLAILVVPMLPSVDHCAYADSEQQHTVRYYDNNGEWVGDYHFIGTSHLCCRLLLTEIPADSIIHDPSVKPYCERANVYADNCFNETLRFTDRTLYYTSSDYTAQFDINQDINSDIYVYLDFKPVVRFKFYKNGKCVDDTLWAFVGESVSDRISSHDNGFGWFPYDGVNYHYNEELPGIYDLVIHEDYNILIDGVEPIEEDISKDDNLSKPSGSTEQEGDILPGLDGLGSSVKVICSVAVVASAFTLVVFIITKIIKKIKKKKE